MAFGLLPKYQSEVWYDGLTRQQFLVIAHEVVDRLSWNVSLLNANELIAYTNFSLRSFSEKVHILFEEEKAIIKSECTSIQLFDLGKNKDNVEKFRNKVYQLGVEGVRDELDIRYQDIENTFLDDASDTQPLEKRGFLSLFIPKKNYIITPIIVYVNVLIYLLISIESGDWFFPSYPTMIDWGANFRPSTLEGGWWRLITSFFLHFGLLHLVMNMYALMYIGYLLEPKLGTLRFSVAYILAGIAASTTSLLWNEMRVCAGASGAIFGMYGVFIALLSTDVVEKTERKAFLMSVLVFVGYSLVNGFRATNVDNAAHVGGLVSGLFIGYAYYPSLYDNTNEVRKYVTIVTLSLVIGFISFLSYGSMPNYLVDYEKKMQRFVVLESMAMEGSGISREYVDSVNKEAALSEIKDRGIYYWDEILNMLYEINNMEIPKPLLDRNKILIEYCNKRIEACRLQYKSIEQNTDIYDDSLSVINSHIENLIVKIKVEYKK